MINENLVQIVAQATSLAEHLNKGSNFIDGRSRGERGREQGEQALPLCCGAKQNSCIKPRPSRELDLKRSKTSVPVSPLPPALCFPVSGSDEQQANDQLLERWCKVAAQGNWEKFHKRLQWDGLNIDTVRSVLSSVPLVESEPLPTWAETLREIMQTSAKWNLNAATSENWQFLINNEKPLPFADVWFPVVLVGRQKLLTALGAVSLSPDCLLLKLLSEEAYQQLERVLLQRLVNLSAKTLQFEFNKFRPDNYNLLNLMLEKLNLLAEGQSNNSSKKYYIDFVNQLLQDGFLGFFQKYAVLGRLIATSIDFWVEAIAEFIQRLQADKAEIESILDFKEIYLGKVTAISGSISDFHNRGRSVLILTFASGQKLVYKPKDLGLEVIYNQLLDWCNQEGAPLPFKVIRLLDRHTYGWVLDYVEQQPCEDEAAAQRFYQRAGMLLCLLYVLGGNDCHYENLIASGEHPVLVDAETLLHPQANPIEGSVQSIEEMTEIEQQFQDSVLRTGLLPRWDFSPDKRVAYDVSAIGSVNSQQAPWRVPRWKAVNTDEMHLVHEEIKLPVQTNVPMLDGVALSPNDYLEEIVTGFRQMYDFLRDRRAALLANDDFVTALKAQQVRFIFRPTNFYHILLEKTLTPEFLRYGVERSIELDIICQTCLTSEQKPQAWAILRSELPALEQLDIPYFGTSCSSDALTIGLKQPIEKYFKQPSYNQFLWRLQNLNETDLASQIGIIRGSFYARVVQTPITEEASKSNSLKVTDFSKTVPLTSSQLLQKAEAIAAEIEARCLRDSAGNVNWIGFGYVPNAERFQFQPLGFSLYDGSSGVALFLAAIAHLTGSNHWGNLALDALQSLQKVLQTSNDLFAQKFARRIGIGGGTGIGSIIYSLVKISQFLSNTAVLENAQLAAKLITPELISADQQLDIIGGTAGAMLGLLSLYQLTGDLIILDQAIQCGQHLLAHRVSKHEQPKAKAWKNIAQQPLTGFSHGAAGIAYALLRLYAVTKDQAYLQASEEGIAYERSVFSTAVANWPDLRQHQPRFMVTWCHGAPGIGLARLGGLSIYQTDEIYQDVEVALQTTQKYGLQGVDHLCCGNFGRIEVLLVAAQKLSRPQLLEIAQKKAAWVVTQADKISAYQLFNNLPNSLFNPGFFQGTAGIGYELLRLAYPEMLPAVLLWE